MSYALTTPEHPPMLAQPADVQAALGRDLTDEEAARVPSILRKASALFREESGQLFTAGSSHVQLKVNGGQVYLPQRPVVAVEEVTDVRGNGMAFDRFGQWLTIRLDSARFVRVKYTHGGEIPSLVIETIAEIARKVLTIDPDAAAGVAQTSLTGGPYTGAQTYATWALGGQTLLAPEDVAIARRFRVRVGAVWVQQP